MQENPRGNQSSSVPWVWKLSTTSKHCPLHTHHLYTQPHCTTRGGKQKHWWHLHALSRHKVKEDCVQPSWPVSLYGQVWRGVHNLLFLTWSLSAAFRCHSHAYRRGRLTADSVTTPNEEIGYAVTQAVCQLALSYHTLALNQIFYDRRGVGSGSSTVQQMHQYSRCEFTALFTLLPEAPASSVLMVWTVLDKTLVMDGWFQNNQFKL